MVDQISAKPTNNTMGKVKKGQGRGRGTPIYNMGVSVSNRETDTKYPRVLDNVKIIKTKDGDKQVLHSVPCDSEVAAHDWVTWSFGLETFGNKYLVIEDAKKEETYDQLISDLDTDLFEIFGFGIGKKRDKGMHFFTHSYELQDGLGMVLIGHKSHKISIQINGTGCALAAKDWQQRLYRYMTVYCQRPSLSRVDLCVDDLEGQYPIEYWDQQETDGGFWTGGRFPKVQHYGPWKFPDGSGRTLMIGDRENGKCLRLYERGKKEGDSISPWVRAEVEFKSVDRHIPLDILIAPSQYFLGAYPAMMVFAGFHNPERIATVAKAAKINWNKAIEITKLQFGKYISAFRKVYSDSELISLITASDDSKFPKRLDLCDKFAIYADITQKRNAQLNRAYGYSRLQTAAMLADLSPA